VGALFGLQATRIDRCRYLEIGCGNGNNLLPMAWTFPDSEFVGIDLAARPVSQAQEMIAGLQLQNARILQKDILDLRAEFGTFDYIVAHGVYSWVPPQVQDHLFNFCRSNLNPNGVVYISYNAYPGGHLRDMLREMLLFHIRGCETAEERIEQATALVRFLADRQHPGDEYRRWMRAELATVLERQEGHFFHDELAETNRSYYFTDFVAKARAVGMQYLGEADFFEMSDDVLTPEAQQTVRQLTGRRVVREQYLDFLKCRRFRQTLLCHGEVPLAAQPMASAVCGMRVASEAKVSTGSSPNLNPNVSLRFEGPKGARAETDYSLGKAALLVLAEIGPFGMGFDELLERSLHLLRQAKLPVNPQSQEADNLSSFLLRLYGAGIIELRTRRVPGTASASKAPAASPVARWQIRRGNWVCSLFHVAVQVEDEIGRQLLLLLDGTRDRETLVNELLLFLSSKGVRGPSQHDNIREELEQNLTKLARLGLLVG
jgi:SAM-dependent methyltransferase